MPGDRVAEIFDVECPFDHGFGKIACLREQRQRDPEQYDLPVGHIQVWQQVDQDNGGEPPASPPIVCDRLNTAMKLMM